MASEKLEDLGVPQRLLVAIRNEVQKASQEQLNDIWMVVHSLKDSAGGGSGPTPALEEMCTRVEDLTRRLDDFDAEDSLSDEEIRELLEDTESKFKELRRALTQQLEELEQRIAAPADGEKQKRIDLLSERLAQLEGRSERVERFESRLDALEVHLAERLSELKGRSDQVAEREPQLKELGDRVSRLEGRNHQGAERESQLKDLGERLSRLEGRNHEGSQLKDLGERLSRLEGRSQQSAERESQFLERMTRLEAREGAVMPAPPPSSDGKGVTDDDLACLPSNISFNLFDLLKVVVKHRATDLHLKAGARPTARLSGELVPIGKDALTEVDCRKLILAVLPLEQRAALVDGREVDHTLSMSEGRFRLSGYLGRSGISASCRLLPESIPDLPTLGLPSVLGDLALRTGGLLILSGPPGSGKSTTLAALLDHINTHRKVHIIAIEDPIEFHHQDKRSFICQREIGKDTASYAEAIRHATRQNPDVIAVGSTDDAACLLSAVQAAQAGHLVLTTYSADNPVVAVDQMLAKVAPEQRSAFQDQLAESLLAICAQRLLDHSEKGIAPITELLIATPAVRSFIQEGFTRKLRGEMEKGEEGMHTFAYSLERWTGGPPPAALSARGPYASSEPSPEVVALPEAPSTEEARPSDGSDDALLGWL